MEHYQPARTGVTETVQARDNKVVSTGWRTPTTAQDWARDLDVRDQEITKGRTIVALKKVAAYIGLKASDILLVDTLMAFSQLQDWLPGRRPIVWPSNALLGEQTGLSVSAIKRHMRKLGQVGLIAFRDSPNGKRWGYRSADNHIREAYGLDLSPLAVRTPEFEALFAQIQEERNTCARIRRDITTTRRTLRAWADADMLPLDTREQFEALLTRSPNRNASSDMLQDYLNELSEVMNTARKAVSKTETTTQNTEETTSKGVKNDPHIEQPYELEKTNPQMENYGESDSVPLYPEFSTWAKSLGLPLTNQRNLYEVAEKLAPMIGVSKQTLHRIQETMGPDLWGPAFAITFEKFAKGLVRTPCAYLATLADKLRNGELSPNQLLGSDVPQPCTASALGRRRAVA